jgi:uncharacterized cupin superfamily protein
MKKIDLSSTPVRTGSDYPPPFDAPCADRRRQGLARPFGLTKFGVNLLVLEPGVWSSQRHWHSREDEFVWVLEGEVTLVTDAGEEILHAGDCAAFRAGDPDGHHLINRSDQPARLLEVGNADPDDVCTYSDIDMVTAGDGYAHKDGVPYPPKP